MDGGVADDREPRVDLGPQEMVSPLIPDELLLDIFRRFPNPADLVRTSAACVSFRRLVADRSFLRLYRKLHAPPLLGFLDRRHVFHPAMAPHPSASAALAADFSFSFLPARAPARAWVLKDIRDGRVLLDRAHQCDIRNHHKRHSAVVFPELVVCDPLPENPEE